MLAILLLLNPEPVLAEPIMKSVHAQEAKKQARLAIEINIPAFRAELLVDGKRESSWPIAVGMPRYPTPTGSIGAKRR